MNRNYDHKSDIRDFNFEPESFDVGEKRKIN